MPSDIGYIDLILNTLYKQGTPMHLKNILSLHGLVLDEKEQERLKIIVTVTDFARTQFEYVEAQQYSFDNDIGLALTREGITMLMQNGSYSNYLKKKRQEEKKKNTDRGINNFSKIFPFLLGLLTIFVGLLSYYRDTKLQTELDSLKQLIQKQQIEIDSIDSLRLIDKINEKK